MTNIDPPWWGRRQEPPQGNGVAATPSAGSTTEPSGTSPSNSDDTDTSNPHHNTMMLPPSDWHAPLEQAISRDPRTENSEVLCVCVCGHNNCTVCIGSCQQKERIVFVGEIAFFVCVGELASLFGVYASFFFGATTVLAAAAAAAAWSAPALVALFV